MPDYDFHTLSPIDFEILVRDLLQEHLKIRLENFKPGRDQGIDLRYAPCRGKKLIVQCKHYTGSSYKALVSHLKREELEKVTRLKPSRYLLATSLGLTPFQKDGLVRLFSPFTKSPEDVYGREDLNNLLGIHQDVEKRTFKLWFSSTSVFEEILQTKVHNLTRETLARIQKVARYYVQNDSFGDALRILDESNYCIIAGIPGIGKTTLAEMLLLHHVALGYEVAKIEGDIAEASEVDYTKRKRVFYYDDFLGQSSIADKLDKNEDQRLLDFMEAIRRSKVSKLILTTREYILNQAKLVYEKIDRARFEREMCIVDISKYTRLIRAKILFNHVYFSSMPPQYRAALTTSRDYLRIIDHPNYSPRIVEYMTDYTRVSDIQPSDYVGFFIGNLDNPAELWRHAFESQLSQAARDLLVVLVSMPREVFLEDLELAFRLYHDEHAKVFGGKTEPYDFKRSLKESDGNFIKTEKSREQVVVQFHNPSIRDFLQNYLAASQRELEALMKTAAFFDQLEWLWQYRDWRKELHPFRASLEHSAGIYLAALRRTLATTSCHLVNYRDTSGGYWQERLRQSLEQRALLLMSIAGELQSAENTRLVRDVMKQIEERVDKKSASPDDLARTLVQLKSRGFLETHPVPALVIKAKEYLKADITWIEEVEPIAQVLEHFPEAFSQGERKEIANLFVTVTKDYVSGGGSDDPDVIRQDIEHVDSLAKKLKVDMSGTIKELESQAEELEADAKKDPPDEDARSRSVTEEWCSDEEIHSMFDSLSSSSQ